VAQSVRLTPSTRPGRHFGAPPRLVPVTLLGLTTIAVAAAVMVMTIHHHRGTAVPRPGDYVSADRLVATGTVVPAGPAASTGSWTTPCGRDENGHHNADNMISKPGQPGGAMHMHDYVGNLATDAETTDADLEAAGTTCAYGDRSTYYWPSLRVIGAGSGVPSTPVAGNTGRILRPDSVLVQFRGNPVSKVLPMPILTRAVTGNASALTERGVNAEHVQWGCSGKPGFSTRSYPLCPAGQRLTRTFDFPSCWDGRRTDSPTHRAHLVFPDAGGACPEATFAVPQLHVVVAYTIPTGLKFAIDAMPGQLRSPLADHSDFIDVMPAGLMNRIVGCLNSGRTC